MPATKRAASRLATAAEPVPVNATLETWRNVTRGTVFIHRTGEYGRRVTELIRAGRVFQVTPQERRNLQNLAANDDLDLFTNGMLKPVELAADDPDAEALQSNPNAIDDDEARRILALGTRAFNQRVAAIDSLPAINRLVAASKEDGGATFQQFETIQARARELNALKGGIIEPDDAATDDPKPVTPR